MNCTKCGNPLEPGVKFCGSCGQPVTPEPPATEALAPLAEDMPTEFVQETSLPGFEWTLTCEGEDPLQLGERVLLGRSSDCDVMLEDTEASRQHALIEMSGEGYTLTDQGSTNGTFVNEERVSETVPLKDEDTIRIGSTIFSIAVTGGGEEQVCPSCGVRVAPGITFCGACGHPLSVAPAPVQPAPVTPASSPVQPARAAPALAAQPPEGSEALPPPKLKPSRRGLLIGCGVALVLGLVAACCVFTVPAATGFLEWLLDLIYEIRYSF